MKKIIYILLFFINAIIWAQNPTIHPLTGGFTFTGEKLVNNTQVFGATTPTGCGFTFSNSYKFYSFKANFDMVFAFDLISTKPDFNFIVWKLAKDKVPTAIFDRGGTIVADRSVYDKVQTVKGMKESETDKCENLGGNGYVNAFQNTEILKKDETVVIAIYGINDTDTFDIKVNVAEERQVTTFNNLCAGQAYMYNQLFDAVKTDSGLTDIKLYTNNTFSTEINASATFTSDTTIYAQVRDASGNLKYIYTIPVSFVPEHVFNFKSSVATEFACTTTYVIPTETVLLNKLFDSVLPDYTISSISVNGTIYNSGDTVSLSIGEETSMKIKVHYGGSCPIDSPEVSIPLKQGSPVLSINISDATCDTNYTINFDTIYSKLAIDKTQFNLVVTLLGVSVSDGSSSPITSSLTYKVKTQSKSSSCESNEVDFIVTKTSPANIVDDSIHTICLDDFKQADVDNAISTIQNGNSYTLKYYQTDGVEIQATSLLNYIVTNKNGKVIVKALASDNVGICDTEKELTFALNQSSFIKVENIETLKSSCSEVGLGYTFTVTEIENYLKIKFSRNDLVFSGINSVSLTDNQTGNIRFKVKINGEQCWSEEMILSLQVITKPDVQNAIKELKADCNDLVTIDENTIKDLFGANSTTDYDIEILHNNSTPLTFVGGKADIKVIFKNKIDNACSVEKIIVVNNTEGLSVDNALLDSYTQANEIVYCIGEVSTVKTKIQTILDYIRIEYPTLVSTLSVDEIFTKFNSDKGAVDVIFNDPNYCGTTIIKFYYQRNTLPTITVPEKGQVCSGELFVLDFTSQTNFSNYNYIVEKVDGSRVSGIDSFNLEVGTYRVTIEDKSTNCSIVETLVVESSPIPTIEKITINQNSIIVSAKGDGTVEYALFDELGNIVANWQRNSKLEIPATIINNNFTVKVRLNNCGIVEVSNIVYLDLPNFISPNNDGKNDYWQPMTKKGQAIDTTHAYKLLIFDRFGKQIVVQEGIDIIKWDGKHNGNPVPDGTYWYLLEFSKENSMLQVQYSGNILVKRKIN